MDIPLRRTGVLQVLGCGEFIYAPVVPGTAVWCRFVKRGAVVTGTKWQLSGRRSTVSGTWELVEGRMEKEEPQTERG